MIPTKHMAEERLNRWAYINATIGVGEVVARSAIYLQNRTKRETHKELTSTGCILIRGDGDEVITCYIATEQQAKEFYADGQLPLLMEAVVRRNKKMGYIWKQDDKTKQEFYKNKKHT